MTGANRIECPNCLQTISFFESGNSRRVECPACHTYFTPQAASTALGGQEKNHRRSNENEYINTPASRQHRDTSASSLITLTWLCCALSFLPFIGIPASIMMLINAIRLVQHRDQSAKTNGWIAICLWIFTFIIGFLAAVNR